MGSISSAERCLNHVVFKGGRFALMHRTPFWFRKFGKSSKVFLAWMNFVP